METHLKYCQPCSWRNVFVLLGVCYLKYCPFWGNGTRSKDMELSHKRMFSRKKLFVEKLQSLYRLVWEIYSPQFLKLTSCIWPSSGLYSGRYLASTDAIGWTLIFFLLQKNTEKPWDFSINASIVNLAHHKFSPGEGYFQWLSCLEALWLMP